ncbi:MAG: response regulator [Thermoanaerobaculia bacterium]|nr:response regulator [Thermoanaerobaculia bacterium]
MRTSTVVDFHQRRPRLADETRKMPSDQIPVLLVEPDPLMREMLQATLRLHGGHFAPVAAGGVQEALFLAPQAAFRLVVCTLELPTAAEGGQLLRRLAEILPGAPLLALTEGSRGALSALIELDAAVVLKPLDIDHLLRRVDALLERQGDSHVRGISLEGLLQVLAVERKTCRLLVQGQGEQGPVAARLGLVAGRLVHAETVRETGTAALFEALGWREPTLRILAGDTAERTIDGDLDSLLLRYCIEADHRRRESD